MPKYEPSAAENMVSGDCYNATPQHFPVRFTDDFVLNIPIPYRDLLLTDGLDRKNDGGNVNGPVHVGRERRKSSLFGKLKRKV